ncbi:MAG: 1-deoxy-D-xylulose-5-phosphate reductoisomerase [Bdellovibrionales bacterium]|nr:1-deoxy-D-xylulose-5-phosphate reductoisomerase [Bdellovibrionales bacterium]
MNKNISILGSTGSIGKSALEIVKKHPEKFTVLALAAGGNLETLAQQIQEYRPKTVSIKSASDLPKLKSLLGDLSNINFQSGVEGAIAVATHPQSDIVLSAIVGAAGLVPTQAAIEAGKDIALANKESLVVAGAWMMNLAKKHGVQIYPVDSEHSAIFQALANHPKKGIRRLILTASGGPFFEKYDLDLSQVTKAQALAHPNWAMGEKITIDSATMMNKGLEVIEAKWLFDLPISQVEVVVHPQSIVHSMVEFVDGSILSQMGEPDMAVPIAYALSYPNRLDRIAKFVDFTQRNKLTFFTPDHQRFPAVNLARSAVEMGPTHPAVLNGANEVTVEAFLGQNIAFTDIVKINQAVLTAYMPSSSSTLQDYIDADQWGRMQAQKYIENISV